MSPVAEQLILSLDRGNSSLDCRLQGAGIAERARLDPDPAALQSFLGDRVPWLAIGLSAVPGGLSEARQLLSELGCDLLLADEDLACPLQLDYAPGQLGVDRWVAALAACRLSGDALVVDCGSAVTIDLVTAAGRFAGGIIAPGREAFQLGLAARAPSLPLDRAEQFPDLPPASSAAAIGAGLGWGFVSMVDGLVSRMLSASGLRSPSLLLTGGDAELLAERSDHEFELRPALIHEGLACLLSEYRSGS
ncbi:MAG: type III pantothenate kinase [Planctomycetota bacterium]|jgi:pantothenate kinase type III